VQGNQPDYDAFISKLNPAGDTLLYSTYPSTLLRTSLGGAESDTAHGIALDSAGRIVIVGETESSDFPNVNAYQTTFGGGICDDAEPCDDFFVTQLSADGTSILYSTFLGGTEEDDGMAVAVDANGFIYVTGYAGSSNFPTVNALDDTFGGGTCSGDPCTDAIVAKIDPAASGSASLLYSTLMGYDENDKGQGIAVDSTGHVYVAGYTKSNGFPTLNPLQANRAGSRDAFLVKLDPDAGGSASLLYGTYLGGSSDDRAYAIALGGTNQVYLTGFVRSSNFPTVNAFDDTFGGGTCGSRDCFDAFVAHLDLDTNTLVYSSYLGGTSDEEGWGIAVDGSGNAYVTGYTMSTDFPAVDAIQETKGADGCSAAPCADAFVTRVDGSGSSLVYSTYPSTPLQDKSGWQPGGLRQCDPRGWERRRFRRRQDPVERLPDHAGCLRSRLGHRLQRCLRGQDQRSRSSSTSNGHVAHLQLALRLRQPAAPDLRLLGLGPGDVHVPGRGFQLLL
jgi:hypothetical protein